MRYRGEFAFSLVEAVFSSFLLLTAVTMSVYLFDASLRAQAENDVRMQATLVAQSRLDEIRAYADTNFGSGLALFDGLEIEPPEAPNLKVKTRAARKQMYLPCTELETQYAPGAVFPQPERKTLEKSAWQVEVEARWSDRPADRVTLVSYVGDWRRGNFNIRITPNNPAPIPPRDTLEFEAVATDDDGRRLDDLVLSWYVNPLDGLGTISRVSRDGTKCLYKNHFRDYDGSYKVQPGQCELEVRAVFAGVERRATRVVVNE